MHIGGWRFAPRAAKRVSRFTALTVAATMVVTHVGYSAPGDSDAATVSQRAARDRTIRPRTLTVAATGDILPHSQLWGAAAANASDIGRAGFDYRPMFRAVKPLLSSVDLAICHLETPIAPWGEPYTTYPAYGVQPEVAEAIADAGYRRCSTASNHTFDRGVAAIDRTVDELAVRGVSQSGMAKSPVDIEPHVVMENGIALCHLSYTYGYNGLRPPPGQEWRSALIDPARIVADARRARQLGAELVIVSMHWGTEGSRFVDGYQRAVANAITAPGVIDLVIGHHAHVLQPIEKINGTWVYFGTGNVLSNMPTSSSWPPASQDAAVFVTDLTVQGDGRVTVARPRVYPTWVDKGARHTILPVQSSLAASWPSPATRVALQHSLARTSAVLGPYIAPEP